MDAQDVVSIDYAVRTATAWVEAQQEISPQVKQFFRNNARQFAMALGQWIVANQDKLSMMLHKVKAMIQEYAMRWLIANQGMIESAITTLEDRIIDRIYQDHPEWRGKQASCPPCLMQTPCKQPAQSRPPSASTIKNVKAEVEQFVQEATAGYNQLKVKMGGQFPAQLSAIAKRVADGLQDLKTNAATITYMQFMDRRNWIQRDIFVLGLAYEQRAIGNALKDTPPQNQQRRRQLESELQIISQELAGFERQMNVQSFIVKR